MTDTTGVPTVVSTGAHRVILESADIERALTRIAHEILEANKGSENLVLLGIPRRGFPLAQRLADKIAQTDSGLIPLFPWGSSTSPCTVMIYSQNLGGRLSPTRLPAAGIEGRTVVLVDDVLFSGRTIRAALDALKDYGRPEAVRLAVLVDRGHRQLPIRADHVGKNLPTSTHESVKVLLSSIDGEDDKVMISQPTPGSTSAQEGGE